MEKHTLIRWAVVSALAACLVHRGLGAPTSALTAATSDVGPFNAKDRMEIQELIARYGLAEDSGDVEGWVKTFSVDGTFKPPGATIHGREALREFITERMKRPEATHTRHWTGEIVVTPSFEGAHATSYEMVIESLPDGTFRVRSVETKTDELQREDGQWVFKSRVNQRWPDASPKPPPDT